MNGFHQRRRSLREAIFGPRVERKRRARELMPNLLIVVLVISAIIIGLECFDWLTVSAAQAALARPDLTPGETAMLGEILKDVIEADNGNDGLVKYAVGGVNGVLLALTQRNGFGGDKELDAIDKQITRLEGSSK